MVTHDGPRPGVAVWTLGPRNRTGGFLGWGSILHNDIVVLHPAASASVSASGPTRLRVRLRDDTGVDVIDGSVSKPSPHAGAGLVAVNLDFATRCAPTLDPLPPRPTPRDIDRLVQQITHAGADDPAQPPPAPVRPGHTPPDNSPGLSPPWCAIWPNAWGCD